jgi:Ca2+-dependent lipid-binding protein
LPNFFNASQANVFGSSDPYVDIETIDQEMRSETIYSTTNPEWNETYDVVVYDRGSQVISFTVSDFDVTNQNMCLGKAEFEVNKIPYNTRVQKTLQLKGVDKGSLIVSCFYVPMATTRSASEKDPTRRRVPRSVFKGEALNLDDDEGGERDVLFDLPMEELHSDEVLISGDLALQMPEEELDAPARSPAGLGNLMISTIRLRSLKAGANSAWKPCVSFHVGTTKKQTRSKKNIVNPAFDEHFAFVIKDRTMTERILVKVQDKNRIMAASRQVGEVAVSLFDVLNTKVTGPQGATIDREYEVESEQVDCVVGFKMQWFSTQGSGRQ